MKEQLSISKKDIGKVEKITGIKLDRLFQLILVNNCMKDRDTPVSWSDIYTILFLENKAA
jgi:hypothetical protein